MSHVHTTPPSGKPTLAERISLLLLRLRLGLRTGWLWLKYQVQQLLPQRNGEKEDAPILPLQTSSPANLEKPIDPAPMQAPAHPTAAHSVPSRAVPVATANSSSSPTQAPSPKENVAARPRRANRRPSTPSDDAEAPLSYRRTPAQLREKLVLFTPRRKNRNFFLSVLLTTTLLLVLLLAAAGVAGIGAGIGIARAYVATTPELDLARIEDQSETSFLYDRGGNLITTISGMENRIWASYDEIPQSMINAIVSIEDRRFYSHEGIDIKRIVGAFVSNLTSSSTQGGSTLTQQLIKMRILSPEQTYKRKLQEAYLALELEKKYSKEDILEAYLNTLFLGQSNYGIKTAAMDYFGKDLNQLTLRECAMLAGLAKSPYSYDPRRNYYVKNRFELTNMRTDLVLNAMFENGCITEEELQEALAEEVHILEKSSVSTLSQMPYFVEFAVQNVIDHMLRQRQLPSTDENRALIERELRTRGYHIYTTLDPALQTAVQDAVYNYENLPAMANAADATAVLRSPDGTSQTITQPQASVTVVENSTGYLAAMVGGTYEPRVARGINRAWQTRMPIGSSIKPLAIYAPALEAGLTPGSVVYNIPAPVTGWGTERGYPNNYGGGGFTGPTTVRTALYKSLNVVAARLLMDNVGIQTSADYLAQMGIASDKVNKDGPGLALGTSGISTLELAGAYSVFPGLGEYTEPVAFIRILDSRGNIILSSQDTQIRREVFSQPTAYLMTDLLVGAVQKGTGTRAKIENITTGGKTGTNSDSRGVSFAGFTPYYTGAVWVGSDYYKPLKKGAQGSRDAAPLFQAVMNKLHTVNALEDKPIFDVDAEALGLTKAEYCDVSGQLATDLCRNDAHGHNTHKDWFRPGQSDNTPCQLHQTLTYCTESGLLASKYCPEEGWKEKGAVIVTPDSPLAQFPQDVLLEYLPDTLFGEVPPQLTDPDVYDARYFDYEDSLCTIHTQEWKDNQDRWMLLAANSQALRTESEARLEDLYLGYPETAMALHAAIQALDAALEDPNYNADALETAYEYLLNQFYSLPPVYVPPEPDDNPENTNPTE